MLGLSMPKRTILQCGSAAVISVALTSWLHIRPLGIVFLLLFTLWFYETRCNLRIVPPPELIQKYEQVAERLADLRKTKPAMFCAIVSGCLAVVAILGHFISGSTVVLILLVLAAIVSTKYNFKLIKIEPKDFAWADKLIPDTDVDDEFIPEVNESNLFVLERASNLASLSSNVDDAGADDEEKSDEIPSELLLPDQIPEINENTDEDDDLVPIMKKDKAKLEASRTTSSTVMEFKKGHFKRDSSLSTTSSSSEESLSKGLQFPDHTEIDAPRELPQLQASSQRPADASDLVSMALRSQTQALLASGKLLPSLMSGIVQWGMGNVGGGDGGVVSSNISTTTTTTTTVSAMKAPAAAEPNRRVVTALDSSDDSDFEILENEDFN